MESDHLKRRNDFNKAYRQGKKQFLGGVGLYALKRRGTGKRVGFAVARSVRGAVQRNRVKRVLREIYRAHENELTPGMDYIVMGRCEALPGMTPKLERQFVSAATKLGVLSSGEPIFTSQNPPA